MVKEEKRVIACTQDNAQGFKQLVHAWPDLRDLVKDLQAQGCFPGLRAMQVTVEGDPQVCAQGLDAAVAIARAAGNNH